MVSHQRYVKKHQKVQIYNLFPRSCSYVKSAGWSSNNAISNRNSALYAISDSNLCPTRAYSNRKVSIGLDNLMSDEELLLFIWVGLVNAILIIHRKVDLCYVPLSVISNWAWY